MRTTAQAVADAADALVPVTDTPRLDAEILLAHALGISRSQLLGRLRNVLPPEAAAAFQPLLARRLNYEPIAYILGTWEFFSLEFITRPPVLVPRPETEHLVEVTLEHLRGHPGRVLDLCTGTGCVAIAIAINAPNAVVLATDIHPSAVSLARENCAKHQVDVTIHQGDLFAGLSTREPRFDVVVSNPPYVPDEEWTTLPAVIRLHEDPKALLAGRDGLDMIRRIIAGAPGWLNPGGLLALELGEDQYDAVASLLAAASFRDIGCRHDLAGIRRIIHGATP
ncbi:MAG: peptide chain release factor N(5)-glutamine methyltransferase [Candidatus Hydrogenedentes bacterium]|nr:peptide chain release factor N(5)-glutamine methyltransferase [Candidatus Hydrogenedentota bacterium]